MAEFLLHLFQQDREGSTKNGYKTAVTGALKVSNGQDLGTDSRLAALFHSFNRKRPSSDSRAPPWDLIWFFGPSLSLLLSPMHMGPI